MNRDPVDDPTLRAQVPGSDAEMFIQWMAMFVCMDFICDCGFNGHVDGAFARYIRCGQCDAVYDLGTQVGAKRLPPGAPTWTAPLVTVDP